MRQSIRHYFSIDTKKPSICFGNMTENGSFERRYYLTKSSQNRLFQVIVKENLLLFGNENFIYCDLLISGKSFTPKE